MSRDRFPPARGTLAAGRFVFLPAAILRPRLALVVIWVVLVALPLAVLGRELLLHPSAWRAWEEFSRLFLLLINTLILSGGTLALTLPTGAALALILFRSDLPCRTVLRQVVVLGMFVPLPLLAAAWQAFLSATGWAEFFPVSGASAGAIGSGGRGMPIAIVVHSAAGLPWVIWLIGQGLLGVERHLEEDAIVQGGAWSAALHVVLPRTAPALAAAALWLGVQTASEITVTDMMQVRTFAEEVNAQFTRPDPGSDVEQREGLARALVVATPPSLLVSAGTALLLSAWLRRLPPLSGTAPAERPLVHLGRCRWLALLSILGALGLVIGTPIASLMWKAGHVPPGSDWSPAVAMRHLVGAWRAQHALILVSLMWSAATGMAVALLALFTLWAVRESRGGLIVVAALLLVLWTLPGPVLGISLKETISLLLDREDQVLGGEVKPLRWLLYNGPSAAPVIWCTGLRFLPAAVAMLWPTVRLIPRESRDAAATDHATPAAQMRHILFPFTARSLGRAALVVTALCLGELSASKLVETPGVPTLAHEIFTQMHTGVSNHLAALCLILLGIVALGWAAAGAVKAWGQLTADPPPPR